MESLHLFPFFRIPPVLFARNERYFGFCAQLQRKKAHALFWAPSDLKIPNRDLPFLNPKVKGRAHTLLHLFDYKTIDNDITKNDIVDVSEPGSDSW